MSEKAHSTVNGIHGSSRTHSTVNGIHPGSRTGSMLLKDLDDYFIGPRDLEQHSRWPVFMRLHGSVTPEMVMPLFFVGGWSAMITLISKFVYDLGISRLLLTVLGFVVGLALSFRSSTAYER
jgi:putative membrane protein